MDARIREMIRQRAGQRCEYCHLPDGSSHLPFHVEHIVAVVHEPNSHESNLAWACPQCNWHKGPNLATLDPATGEQVALFNPRQNVWDEHFVMENFTVVGLTAIGRGTVQLFKMNLPSRIEVRWQVM